MILLGGLYLKNAETIEGPTTVSQIQSMKYDKAFIGVNGVDRDFGLSTASELEAATKIAAMAQAGRAIVCRSTASSEKQRCTSCVPWRQCTALSQTADWTRISGQEYGALTRLLIAQ